MADLMVWTDENNIMQEVSKATPLPISGGAKESTAIFTRPANNTAYDINDVVGTDAATNLTFANVSNVAGGSVIILGATIRVDVNAVPAGMSGFRLHLYSSAPTAITDNVAYNLPSDDRSKYLGFINIDVPVDLGDTLWSENININKIITLASGSTSIYGLLQTIAAFTPSSGCVKTITLHTVEV